MTITIPLNAHDECEIAIKPSQRAKYLRLKISRAGDVQIVLPTGYTVKEAQAFAVSKKSWIAKTLQSIRQQPTTPIVFPQQFIIPLMQETWVIDYHKTDESCLHYFSDANRYRIQLSGMVDDQATVFRYFDQWLKERGKRCLPLLLDEVSAETGLAYNRVSIRKQKTRWGSCSSQQNINLNCKLLFFPESVVRYVMIHELCHTKEMNHSKRFWSLVEKHDPEYRQHETILKQSNHYVPQGI